MEDQAGDVSILFFAIALAVFALFWTAISHLISTVGGWRSLAAAHGPADERAAQFGAETRRFQSARMGPRLFSANYSGVLNVSAGYGGAVFSVFVFFRPGHDPFSVPYSAFSGREEGVLIFRQVRLTFDKAPNVSMLVNKGLADWIEEKSGGAWSYQRSGGNADGREQEH